MLCIIERMAREFIDHYEASQAIVERLATEAIQSNHVHDEAEIALAGIGEITRVAHFVTSSIRPDLDAIPSTILDLDTERHGMTTFYMRPNDDGTFTWKMGHSNHGIFRDGAWQRPYSTESRYAIIGPEGHYAGDLDPEIIEAVLADPNFWEGLKDTAETERKRRIELHRKQRAGSGAAPPYDPMADEPVLIGPSEVQALPV